jgi:hypothetical protein
MHQVALLIIEYMKQAMHQSFAVMVSSSNIALLSMMREKSILWWLSD